MIVHHSERMGGEGKKRREREEKKRSKKETENKVRHGGEIMKEKKNE